MSKDDLLTIQIRFDEYESQYGLLLKQYNFCKLVKLPIDSGKLSN